MIQPYLKGDPIPNFAEGVLLLVDKPKTWTSFDVVKKIRVIIKQKIGHAGTLDPLATGLMILCTGKFTKRIAELQGLDKSYEGVITLGATRPSFDEETEVEEEFDYAQLEESQLHEAAQKLTGDQMQLPPVYSAIKQDGVKLYKQARKGKKVEVRPRPVTIHKFDIPKVEMPNVHFSIDCSKGTYIRSIAHDFGKALQNGGYLHELVRTKVGEYMLTDAWNLEELVETLYGHFGRPQFSRKKKNQEST